MAATDTSSFPLVDLRAVSNSAHQWVAVHAWLAHADWHDGPADPDSGVVVPGWQAVFDGGDLLTAIAPLDCIVHLDRPGLVDAVLMARLPPSRVVLAVERAALDEEGALRQLGNLQQAGYRILIEGGGGPGAPLPATLRGIAHDGAAPLAVPTPLVALFGPHLAHGVNTAACFDACAKAGFAWFSGTYALHDGDGGRDPDDGTTARRLLKLLGLLLADADTRDIEIELKQDPSLSYQLLRLVNSAAFAPATPIHDFAQAIVRLGRRQLLRWLQLLLFARPSADGLANPLLPIAALRAAQIESLCKQRGGGREAQDLAFQVGVFSLLDVLLGMPMDAIVAALMLPAETAGALLERRGEVGRLLALVEAQAPPMSMLAALELTPRQWWHSQLHGFHWAIQVSRNL
ncbi:HDOD domain-containing protein [Massilia sp. DWR3-1-1]|uniref:HDOD domain-containing protein n=1 Tax=Massilia sp. DWR3-1-1 TaxID=2804559 RepID=UPI003CF07292